MFTLKRVNYDYKTRALVKNNKRFDFEKTIYADKFLAQNRSKDREITEQVSGLRERQKEIKESLRKYKEYHNAMGISEYLQMTREFIES